MEILKKYKYLLGLIGISAALFLYQMQQNSIPSEQSTQMDKDEASLLIGEQVLEEDPDSDAANEEQTVIVDVKGEVQKPGVYEMKHGERFHHVIEKAGGLTKAADAVQINLAAMLEDGMVVYIPKLGETAEDNVQQPAAAGVDAGEQKVNLNHATAEELQTLTGIGPAKAEAILSYREEAGGFKTIEDLMNVPGIGEKSFEKFKDSISVK
ncbi:helix-hairpin-helix domain-containing protein [Bacillus sp. V2I10]|uniref:helix-hairpin-helix domain-containing protein n=1 Tax=Bacillus sp. V2I10 TaxID=3042276 RepID=UPI0027856DB8|nr:helix-hairpin-helix domain-containing protein [Bacillus sp. V2I10]MDQ0858308.1 competence protein ComEA [Bacillus sp. V2I10]